MSDRTVLRSKIHRATVTGADLNYVGSISIGPELMRAADMIEWEKVAVLDIDNGHRFETYIIEGAEGEIVLNGAAARLVQPGDKVIILTYTTIPDRSEPWNPTIVHVDAHNQPRQWLHPAKGGLFADRPCKCRARALGHIPDDMSCPMHEGVL